MTRCDLHDWKHGGDRTKQEQDGKSQLAAVADNAGIDSKTLSKASGAWRTNMTPRRIGGKLLAMALTSLRVTFRLGTLPPLIWA